MLKYKLSRLIILLMLPLFSLSMITACSDDNGTSVTPDPDPQPGDPNLVELAQSDENFSILVDLVVELGLVDVLATEELTVFAPTNAAFEKISDIIPTLTNEDLTEIVTYHVTGGTILSNQLGSSQDVEMLQGEKTLVTASAAGVQVNGFANVVQADLRATNGVIHAIDEVILPTAYRVAVQGPSLVEVAQEAGNFETLLALTEQVGLTTTLQFLGPFTAFAPTDEAFDNLFSVVNPSGLTNEQIGFILFYHVLFGEVPSSALEPTQAVPTAAEELIYITAGAEGVTVNGAAQVIAADVDASNGVIHVIDTVLLPNAFSPVTSIVQKNFDLSTLLALVAERPAVVEALSDPNGEFTVFAPNNDAFADALADNPGLTDEQVTEILAYHVLVAQVLSGDLGEAQTVETLSGEAIYVTVDNGSVNINNSAAVVEADFVGNNGAVHVIDGVLLPNAFTPVTGIVAKNYNLSTLLSLVAEREDILNLLAGDGEFTVFAPTNEAFDAALEAFPDLTEEQITEILTYHVIGAQVLSSDLADGQTAETLQGEEITVSINGGVQINNANVIAADLIGTNGVVHIIDAVILPPSYTE
ncbi:MAG: fasciclin domain-containing protein [Balneolaceae bacterium]|nr:MAG: fasciclin domain-containing protein [Balneolaceae bacterium]